MQALFTVLPYCRHENPIIDTALLAGKAAGTAFSPGLRAVRETAF